ncbi:hypothetical protein L195_g063364, partial [Trifolium pratense]
QGPAVHVQLLIVHARPGVAGYGLSCCASSLVPSLDPFGLQSLSLRLFRALAQPLATNVTAKLCLPVAKLY